MLKLHLESVFVNPLTIHQIIAIFEKKQPRDVTKTPQ